MMLRDNGGPTELGDRVHEMGTTVAGVTSPTPRVVRTRSSRRKRKLIAEVRASSSDEQISRTARSSRRPSTAVESGHLHPSDKEFETGEPAAAPLITGR
jgi:hypothetical protein